MSDMAIGYVKPRTDEEYIAAIDEMLAEIDRSLARTAKHQERIERAKIEMEASGRRSDVILARIDARMKAMEKWVKSDVG